MQVWPDLANAHLLPASCNACPWPEHLPPLVSPKVVALARVLRDNKRKPVSPAGAEGAIDGGGMSGGDAAWCSIVFVETKVGR